MARDLYYGEDARTRLQAGMDQLADAVKATIGPRGRNVLVSGIGGKPITNEASGVTRDFELSDISENLGAQMLREVATKTNDAVGDGTTTAILLTQAIIREGIKNMAAGADPMGLRRGIHGGGDEVVRSIRESAYQLEKKEDIVQVASISGADRQTGEMLGDIMEQVGQDGVITVEESKTMETRFEIVKGSQFDKGYLSEYMVSRICCSRIRRSPICRISCRSSIRWRSAAGGWSSWRRMCPVRRSRRWSSTRCRARSR